MKRAKLVMLGVAVLMALVSCSGATPSSELSGRPECVDLRSYSGVISQVMGVSPVWQPSASGSQVSTWTVRGGDGAHVLAAATAGEGCVCATNATSVAPGAFAGAEMAGLLQGAAVAPISELEYTAGWLNPKLAVRCPLAYFLGRSFEAQETMPDGTTWRLSCAATIGAAGRALTYSFSVLTPACSGAFE